MRKAWFIIVAVLFLAALVVLPVRAQEDDKVVVRGYLFYSPTCPHCKYVRTRVLPKLYARFKQQLQIMAVDISADENNYRWLQACEKKYKVTNSGSVPVLFIGDRYLVGSEEIEKELPALIETYLKRGGVDYPDVPRPGGPLEPTARFMFFFSPTCPHCKRVEEEVFPWLQKKYGGRVTWEAYNVSEEKNYRALLMIEEAAGMPPQRRGGVPMIFIGDEFSLYTILIGDVDIIDHLTNVIDWFMGVGGVDFPEWKEQLFILASTPPPSPTPVVAVTGVPTTTVTPSPYGPPIHLAYFAEVGCSECDRVSIALEHLQKRFPNLVIHEFDIIKDLKLNLCLCEALNVPENKRHDAPAIFVGSDYLVGGDIQYDALIEMVSRYAQTGADPIWEECKGEVALPPPPPWWAVIVPGLVDGLNPCAFATIIFFVSYLSFIGRKGREILMVGISFTLAVFLSYLGFGMVLREVISGLIALTGPVLKPVLNLFTALLCLVLAIISFADFYKARRGRVRDMALRLPDRLRKWINATIRKGVKSETLVTASFITGVVVSFIELTCTGQVYVPIIQGLSNPEYRARSTLDLVVYCLAFVVPLIIVFAISYMGTGSRQLGLWLQRHTAAIKLATALLFVGIGLWLVYDTLRVWGVWLPG